MRAGKYMGVLAAAAVLAAATVALGLDGRSIARLKRAGVSDPTIELMVAERTVETAAFSVEDIVAMKAAGIGEGALQTILREGSFMKDREPVVYGNHLRPLRLVSAADLIELKRAGVSDEVLRAVVEATRPDADIDRERALQQLGQMGIWVEQRGGRPQGPTGR
jgi:hypothetical protein